MARLLLDHAREVYAVAYFAAIAGIALWEGRAPRRMLEHSLRKRWASNFALAALDIALVRITIPVAALGVAVYAETHGIGLLYWTAAPFWIAAIVGFLALDCGRYAQHVLLHRSGLLWRVHRVHHADQDYDFTVGLRFHPLEALFTTGFLFTVILLAGPPPVVVVVTEVLVAISGAFVHANARTGPWIETTARTLIVTPDMHRVHHSAAPDEQTSNYGAVLSIWDRLFRTYTAAPAAGHDGMTIGLGDLRGPRYLALPWMLAAPFLRREG